MKISKIHCLGDYYNDKYLRDICHEIKDGGINFASIIADFMAYKFADNFNFNNYFVPIPSTSKFNRILCRNIGERCNARWCSFNLEFINNHQSLYDLKKNGEKINQDDYNMIWTGFIRTQKIVIVDNVISTGFTMYKALEALSLDEPVLYDECEALCIAVDWNTFKKSEYYEQIYK